MRRFLALALLLLPTVAWSQTASWTFDGADWLACGNRDLTGDMTVAAWVCGTDATGGGSTREDVVNCESSGEYAYRLHLRGDGSVFDVTFETRTAAGATVFAWNGDANFAPATDCSQPEQWHHIAATFDSSNAPLLYLDGESLTVTQVTGSGVAVGACTATTIGGRTTGTERFHGNIAFVLVAQSIFPQGRIADMAMYPMRGGITANPSDTTSLWALWDTSPIFDYRSQTGTTCADPAGTTNDPTISANSPRVMVP